MEAVTQVTDALDLLSALKNQPIGETDATDENRWFSHLYVVSVIALAALFLGVDGASHTRKIIAAILSAMALVVFVVHTKPTMERTKGQAVLGGSIALGLGTSLFAVHPLFFFGLFALYPLCFIAFPPKLELPALITLGVASALAIAGWNGWGVGGWIIAAVQAGLGGAFAFTMGRWIDRVIVQSRERAQLLAALESTRSELANVHRSAGIAAERDRMGTEIHDTLAQGFTSLLMLVRGVQTSLVTNPEGALKLLKVAEQTAQDNLDEARALISNSRPAPLQNAPITAALERLVTQFGRDTTIDASMEILGTPRALDPAQEVVLLRTAQETLANVRKHAQASKVVLQLKFSENNIDLVVLDDGTGFETTEPQSGFGLSGMQARAAQVGGYVVVDSSPGKGTRVQVSL
jgi:signal transduction histidine kinase